jgi:hypothetical protein
LVEIKRVLLMPMIEGLQAGEDWRSPRIQTLSQLGDLAVNEVNHRLAVIWHAEAEMQGGHRVRVTKHLNRHGAFNALCHPSIDDDAGFCWEGPDRDTIEEAEADARRHHPGAVVETWGIFEE